MKTPAVTAILLVVLCFFSATPIGLGQSPQATADAAAFQQAEQLRRELGLPTVLPPRGKRRGNSDFIAKLHQIDLTKPEAREQLLRLATYTPGCLEDTDSLMAFIQACNQYNANMAARANR